MTDEEKAEEYFINQCREYDEDEFILENFDKAVKDAVLFGLDEGRKELEKENRVKKEIIIGEQQEINRLEKESKQIIERERVVPEHYLCEMIEKNKELKADLEEARMHCKAVDEVNEKMKRCANCKNYFLTVCRLSDKKQKICKTQAYKYWELAE